MRLTRPALATVLGAVILAGSACGGSAPHSPAAGPPSVESPSPARAAPSPSPSGPRATVLPADLTPALVTRVIDGDTIEVEIAGRTHRLRYIGIDTPETVDPRRPVGCFGKEASQRNRELVEGQTVGLEKDVSETDEFGRLLRYVWLGGPPSGFPEEARMVNAVLVEEGFALASAYPPDVKHAGMLAALQAGAREAGRGLWGPACAGATPSPAASLAPGVCEFSGTSQALIKGNISSTGERIYHVPGGAYYDETVIDVGKGERWFCSEAEAVAAGWRRAQR